MTTTKHRQSLLLSRRITAKQFLECATCAKQSPPDGASRAPNQQPPHVLPIQLLRTGRTLICISCSLAKDEGEFDRLGYSDNAPGSSEVCILHPSCNECRNSRFKKLRQHPLYCRELEDYWRGHISGLRSNARQRGILVGIDNDDLLAMYLEQDGHCAVTGLAMDFRKKGTHGRGNKAHGAPSVDRIDSYGNYVLGNVQIVLQVVNIMKGDLPMEMFVELCSRIADNQLSVGVLTDVLST